MGLTWLDKKNNILRMHNIAIDIVLTGLTTDGSELQLNQIYITTPPRCQDFVLVDDMEAYHLFLRKFSERSIKLTG